MRGTGKAYRTHVHHSSTPYPEPWSFRVRRWLIKQPGEQSCCCSLIYKSTHFKDVRRIRPLFLPPHPRRNRNTPRRCRKLHIPRADFTSEISSRPFRCSILFRITSFLIPIFRGQIEGGLKDALRKWVRWKTVGLIACG